MVSTFQHHELDCVLCQPKKWTLATASTKHFMSHDVDAVDICSAHEQRVLEGAGMERVTVRHIDAICSSCDHCCNCPQIFLKLQPLSNKEVLGK